MGNLLSVNAATAAARRSERDAAGGPNASVTTGVNKVSTMSQGDGSIAAAAALPFDDDVEPPEPYIDQLGYDPDPEGNWVPATPVPRIKESRLTPEEKAKFRALVAQIFDDETINGTRVKFDANDVVEVVEKVIPYLASEPMLIEDVPFDITIVADLHGQLFDLKRVFNEDEKDGKPAWENMKYLFLGDYVDRGRQSLEIVMGLFCLKMLHPDRIFLLRGNHEFARMNARHGFSLDFADRYPDGVWQAVYHKVNEAFCWLSVAAIVGNIYFCAHGGIDPNACRRHLINTMKPFTESKRDIVIHNLVWSDPAPGLQGYAFNAHRGTSIYYGIDILSLALYNMDCLALFRGHTVHQEGYKIIGHLCFSLFTATGVTKALNDGAVAVISPDGTVEIRVLECNPERRKWDRTLKAWDAGLEEAVPEDDEEDECLTEWED